ncbi:MAG: hypothetical protein EOO07_03960 [Chitinophagaceae bacterium]|nr:MAG: hypothetical protein EOO07_03960 [Chitinophagaceae bacterium]
MLSDYLNLQFDVKGKTFKGFCMRIHDDFHVTYAVILEDCHSFCVWLDEKTSQWCYSKYTIIDKMVLDKIIGSLATPEEPTLASFS